MIWLTWRQYRKQGLYTLVGLAVLAAVIIPTGVAMRNAFAEKGLAACIDVNTEACRQARNQFWDQYDILMLMGILFLALPVLIGLFWGAPLVAREVEHGTHRLVWTQGISRRHWARVKFGLITVAAVVAAVPYGLGLSWWLGPLNQGGEQSRLGYLFFDMQGVVPIAYTLFAVALGITAGTIWPKVVPAMGAALAGFVGLRVAVEVLARPRYQAPETLTYPITDASAEGQAEGGWILDNGIRDASGKMVARGVGVVCPSGAAGPGGAPGGAPCGSRLGLGPGAYNWVLYQPGDRFWLFQTIESGIFVALAAALLFFAIRRVRRIA
ncbi:ABC transporter permease subunit [Phytohabitans rumicis]|uniref:Transporter n=1 Tax=Phytohabitans rumicis TaxID=1076125 RepID=A0A6V8LAB3_9ACTN|nr:ABC transporter permease subunit [Phytohabitans rumicis]GFJ94152.1 transporter [Phytohabitans rumicis]